MVLIGGYYTVVLLFQMASNLVQIEKFESGDFEEFLDNFEISSLASEWEADKKTLMIATCLRGEALQVYKTLTTDERKDYGTVKGKLVSAFDPEDITFTSLSEFHGRKMFSGERPQKYLFELKKFLKKAFPQMAEEAKGQPLFEQFIRGLPKVIYENIRTSSDIKTSYAAMKRAKILIRLESDLVEYHRDNVAIVNKNKTEQWKKSGIL